MIQNWVDDTRSSAEINNDIQQMKTIKAEIWGTRVKPSNPGFDQDIPNSTLVGTCMIRLDLWKGSGDSKPDIVGKVKQMFGRVTTSNSKLMVKKQASRHR